MPVGPFWTDAEDAILRERYDDGGAGRDGLAALLVGRSWQAIRQHALRIGLVNRRRRAIDDVVRSGIVALIQQGYCDWEIAEAIGRHASVVGRERRRMGVPSAVDHPRQKARMSAICRSTKANHPYKRDSDVRIRDADTFARESGWPAGILRMRSLQMLNLLASVGGRPMTRQELFEGVGLCRNCTPQTASSPSGPYIRELVEFGFLTRLAGMGPRRPGRGQGCDLFVFGPLALSHILARMAADGQQQQPQT